MHWNLTSGSFFNIFSFCDWSCILRPYIQSWNFIHVYHLQSLISHFVSITNSISSTFCYFIWIPQSVCCHFAVRHHSWKAIACWINAFFFACHTPFFCVSGGVANTGAGFCHKCIYGQCDVHLCPSRFIIHAGIQICESSEGWCWTSTSRILED